MTNRTPHDRQNGAALLIVLILVASMGFVAISITDQVALTATRSINVRIRSESQWYALGAERLAQSALREVYTVNEGSDSLDDQIFSQVIELPLEDGIVRLFLSDNTACFNLNSLTTIGDDTGSDQDASSPDEEFFILTRNLGLGDFEGRRIASIISDWIDEDTNRLPLGAEDSAYASLPLPYRTGNTPLGAVSELRAMQGVTQDVYRLLKRFLCAHPQSQPSPVNVNMLQEAHAPLLAAILGKSVTVSDANDIILSRPPGGYKSLEEFLESPGVKPLALPDNVGNRFRIRSEFVLSRAEIVYDSAVFEMTTALRVRENGQSAILWRRFGAEE